jgi:hypothetical protein
LRFGRFVPCDRHPHQRGSGLPPPWPGALEKHSTWFLGQLPLLGSGFDSALSSGPSAACPTQRFCPLIPFLESPSAARALPKPPQDYFIDLSNPQKGIFQKLGEMISF